MARTKKITREESKLALEFQAPTKPSVKTISKRGPAAKKAAKQIGSVASFADLREEMRKFTGGEYESDQLEWIKPADLEGKPFYIKRAWTFESSYGSKVGFVVILDESEFLMSLQWSRNRDNFVKAVRSLLRKSGKDSTAGPLTVELVDVGQQNPYIDIVAYRE